VAGDGNKMPEGGGKEVVLCFGGGMNQEVGWL